MSTVKEHLKKLHEKSAEHHLAKAKIYKKLGTSYGAMEKADVGEDTDVADALEELAEQETEMGEFHVECCKSLDSMGKAMGMDGDRLVPDFVSSFVPEMPQNIRAVPRAGQRDLGELTKVDDAFAHLVKIDD